MRKPLPNLDALRFIAASLVVLGHLDNAVYQNGFSPGKSSVFIFSLAEISVVFFFVLSGFLITYLLLLEKDRGPISVRGFYLKRVLRIWPLYFLIVGLCFGIFNHLRFYQWPGLTDNITVSNHPVIAAILLLLIAPNVLMLFTESLGYASPTWSIGVEEQFYLIWPWIMRLRRPVIGILIIVVVVGLLSHGFLGDLIEYFHLPPGKARTALTLFSNFFTFGRSFRVDAMAIGALGAFCALKRPHWLRPFFSYGFQFLTYFFLLLLFSKPGIVSYQLYALVFLSIIMNMALNPRSMFQLGSRFMSYGGKISFGIYLYHLLLIMPILHLYLWIFHSHHVNVPTELILGAVIIAATMLVAGLSYRFFETPFLRLKSRLTGR